MLWRDLAGFVLKLSRRISQYGFEPFAIGFLKEILRWVHCGQSVIHFGVMPRTNTGQPPFRPARIR